jgi:cytochrome c biogenesis protein CcdA
VGSDRETAGTGGKGSRPRSVVTFVSTVETKPDVDGPERAGGVARPAVLAGVLGGLIGATCCIGPAVGVAIGAGTGSTLLAMADYRPHVFVLGAVVAFAAAAVLFVRRRRACPTDGERRALRSRWVDVGVIAFALTYALGRFAVPRLIEAFT